MAIALNNTTSFATTSTTSTKTMNTDLDNLTDIEQNQPPPKQEEDESEEIFKDQKHLTIREFFRKEFIDDFHPVYFVGFLGCGITGNIFYGFPYPAEWLKVCGIIFFCLTILIFLVTNLMLVLSLLYYPKRLWLYIYDYNYSLYFGVYSMGFTTIINGVHLLTKGKYPTFQWVLFWIGTVLAVHNTAVIFFFSYLSKHSVHKLRDINASIFIVIVTCCVNSSNGHLIVENLKTENQKIITEVTALMLFFISLLLFHGVGAIYVVRLILCKVPSTPQVFTQFLPVGFTGQSSYSIMLFGNNMYKLIPDESLGKAFLVSSALLSYALLSASYIYMFLAIVSCLSKTKPFIKNPDPKWNTKRFGLIKWNKGWWTMTFPTGTMSLCSFEISKGVAGYEFLFFKVMAAIIGVALFIICIINVIGLAISIWEKIYDAFFKDLNNDIKVKV